MRNFRSWFVVLVVVMLISSCSAPSSQPSAPPSSSYSSASGLGSPTALSASPAVTLSSPSPTLVSQTQSASPVTEDVQAQFAAGNFTPLKVDLPALGKVNFTTDSTKSVSANFLADGSDVTLILTDTIGLTWKLVVPGIALGSPVTLKMTALKDIKSNDIPGSYKGGILLEPDGLKFRTRALLTVSGAGLNKVMFYTGAQDGSAMNLTVPGADKNSVQIEHFSSLVAGDLDSAQAQQLLDALMKQVSQQDKATVAAAQKFLKEHQKDLTVPTPPAVPVECKDDKNADANNKQLDKFLEDTMQPEKDLIIALLSVEKNKQLLVMNSPGISNNPLLAQLLARLQKKATLLMKTYRGKPEYVTPVAQFALKVARDTVLLGYSDSSFLPEIGDWTAASIDQLIKDIVEQHDYRKLSSAITVARWAALMGSGNSSTQVDTLFNRLEAAMRFNLQATLKYSTLDSIWDLKAEIPMRLNTDVPMFWKGTSKGSIAYTFTQKGNVTATTQPFPINAFITRLDPCKGGGEIFLDRFFGDSETLTVEGGRPVTAPYTKTAWEYSFAQYKGNSAVPLVLLGNASGYVFSVPIRNMDVNAVSQPIEGKTNCGSKCSISFEIKLIHTPQYVK